MSAATKEGDLPPEERRRAWAQAAKKRYQAMTAQERARRNRKHRQRKLERIAGYTDEEVRRMRAERAYRERQRYHAKTPEERQALNQKRVENYRMKRMKEQQLLEKPLGDATPEDIRAVQDLVTRRQRRAAVCRNNYWKMTKEERREINGVKAARKKWKEEE